MLTRGGLAALLAMATTAAGASSAQAAERLSETVTATGTATSCTDKLLSSGGGYVQRTIDVAGMSAVTARLAGGAGDWDVAVFDRETGRLVAGSAYGGTRELASGYVVRPSRLTVQACRMTGGASSAQLSVEDAVLDTSGSQPASMVKVSTPTRARAQQLADLGLDLTEHGGDGFVEVVLHGAADAAKLRQAGFVYTLQIPDLTAQGRSDRRADAAFAAANATTELPSGQNTYRRLFDYGEDLKRLAREHPDLVKPITLPNRTWEGRPVEGIEITTNPNARDGKPVFLQMGAHHAREWPSAEHAMEWAYELILGYRTGDARTRRLVETTRTIVVPVVNPDGFNASREAGELQGAGDGRGGDDTQELINILTHPNEYRRKNCRLVTDSESGSCLQPALGLASAGVDPNRNYGGFWGGPGASGDRTSETYYGPGPFSEPETQNVRELVSERHVTTLITNHTFSNLVLRPPGIQSQGPTPDEGVYKALGDAMAGENGYTSQLSYELYDTTGTTEDWTYYSTGGLGFTYEIGPHNFHPPFEETVAEYEGTTAAADANGDGGGNRGGYFIAQENTADPSKHSVLAGRAPAGAILRLTKTFQTPTSKKNDDGSTRTFEDTLDTTTKVGPDGRFEWHVNPSTRPLVAQDKGRAPTGDPSAPQQFASRGEAVPCANFDDPPETCYEDHKITVPSGAGIDNAKATIRIEWPTPVSDYDMKVYRADADGNATGDPVGVSGQGTTDFEQVELTEPAGDYVVRVINYAAVEPWSGTVTFAGPGEFQGAVTETWTLLCEQTEGRPDSARQVEIARGQQRTLDLRSSCARRR
ncbi:MAG: M14 family metallopeptidase [Solirubrobacteraceae bacterium]